MPLRSRDGVAPGLGIGRVARVEPLDLLEVVCVIAGERTNPREPPDVDAGRLQAAGGPGRVLCWRCHRHESRTLSDASESCQDSCYILLIRPRSSVADQRGP